MSNLTELELDTNPTIESIFQTLHRLGCANRLESLVVPAETAFRGTFVKILAQACPRLRHLAACHMHVQEDDFAINAFIGVYNVRS